MVDMPGWNCQPWKSVPSEESVMRMRRGDTRDGLDRARTGLHHRVALRAERALGGIPGGNAQRFERRAGDADVGAAPAAVDNRARRDRNGAGGAHDVDYFFSAAAR